MKSNSTTPPSLVSPGRCTRSFVTQFGDKNRWIEAGVWVLPGKYKLNVGEPDDRSEPESGDADILVVDVERRW